MNWVEVLPPVSSNCSLPHTGIPLSVTLLLRKSSVAFYCLLIHCKYFTLIFKSPNHLTPACLSLISSGAFSPVSPAPHHPKIHRMYSTCSSLLGYKRLSPTFKNLILSPSSRILYPQPSAPVPPPFPVYLPRTSLPWGIYS